MSHPSLIVYITSPSQCKYFFKITHDNNFKKESIKKNKTPLINGKKPNISERYKIANEVFNVHKVIDKKNISQTEKHILLAHLLGCTEQTARNLFNGMQEKRTHTRDDIVNSYLETLK